MSLLDLTVIIHIVLFCYWLGGDIGVFYSSKFVVDPTLSRETRLVATKIMIGCDLIPKICMSLMLTVGGILTELYGIEHPWWQNLGIILLGPFWLTMVLVLHFKHNAAYIPALTKFDFYFRCFMVVALLVSTSYSLSIGRLTDNPWVAGKLILFAFLVFSGVMIRVNLKGFGETYAKIIADNYNDTDNDRMISSLAKAKPWVYAIWVVLVIECTLGVVKPGSVEKELETPAVSQQVIMPDGIT